MDFDAKITPNFLYVKNGPYRACRKNLLFSQEFKPTRAVTMAKNSLKTIV